MNDRLKTDLEAYGSVTVSAGTMRLQDTLPAILDAIGKYCPTEYEQLLLMPFGPIPAHAMEDDDAEWWDSEAPVFLFEDWSDLLDSVAPEGYYFGAHPGDGACMGFFPFEEC